MFQNKTFSFVGQFKLFLIIAAIFIGVILSMLVMLIASRIMMKALVGLKATNPALYGVKLQKEEK
jgi:hypothetical protein